MPERFTCATPAEYSSGRYMEGSLPIGDAADPSSRDRYDISIHQLHLETPLTGRTDLSFDLVHESSSR